MTDADIERYTDNYRRKIFNALTARVNSGSDLYHASVLANIARAGFIEGAKFALEKQESNNQCRGCESRTLC